MLIFDPFEQALAQLSEARLHTLEGYLIEATVSDIQTLFAAGELTAEELILFYVDRIRRYDTGRLNSVLELNPEALQLARARDAERQAGTAAGPLHGIPILLKDNIATADQMHTTAGALAMRDARTDRDAFIVQQLRDAGAIILGKANLSEWANFMTHDSSNGYSGIGGQTRNPYGAFDTGGSSSGSAVAVAANFAPLSIGTETSGSLTSPASQNSLVTLKPSLGLISRDRIIPITSKMDTAGPMARTVADMSLLLTVLASKADLADAYAADVETLIGKEFNAFLHSDGLRGKRLGLVTFEEYHREGDEEVLARAVPILEAAGAEVVPIAYERPEITYVPVLLYGIRHEVNAYLAAVGEYTPVRTLANVVAFNTVNPGRRAPYGQSRFEEALELEMTTTEYDALAQQNRTAAAQAIRQALTENNLDMLLTLNNTFAGAYAPAGFPALSVPAGYRPNGEPASITLVGDFLSEGVLIAAAYAFEQASQLRQPPNLEARLALMAEEAAAPDAPQE